MPTSRDDPASGRYPGAHVRDVLPYLGAAAFAFATVPLPPATGSHTETVVSAAVVVVLAAFLADYALRRSLGPWVHAAPAYLFLVAVALLRDAEGGAPSGFGMLVLLSLTWLALRSRTPQLYVGIVLMALMFALPILLIGEPAYPASEWRRMLLWCVVGTISARTMQSLVGRINAHARSADMQARTDALTGLPNRRELGAVLDRELQRASAQGTSLVVAMIDLDRFKAFNDTRGHAAGDELLQEAATSWRAVIRAGDVLARYGGEEFTVVLPACSVDAGAQLMDRLRRATPLEQSCSIGVVEWDGTEQPSEMLARADALLYDAKRAGRDRVLVG